MHDFPYYLSLEKEEAEMGNSNSIFVYLVLCQRGGGGGGGRGGLDEEGSFFSIDMTKPNLHHIWYTILEMDIKNFAICTTSSFSSIREDRLGRKLRSSRTGGEIFGIGLAGAEKRRGVDARLAIGQTRKREAPFLPNIADDVTFFGNQQQWTRSFSTAMRY